MSSWMERDRKVNWHPFTQHYLEPESRVIVSAKGVSLFDEDGEEVLDMISSWWTCLHGHAHPEIARVLQEQASTLEHVMFAGFSHKPAIELSEALLRVLPGAFSKVFYSDDGSTAVEVALKLSYQYWANQGETERTRFLSFEKGYHGDTLAAMSVGRGSGFFQVFEGIFCDATLLPYAETWEEDTEVEAREASILAKLDTLLEAEGHRYAALIVEPLLQGAGGMRMCRPDFIRAVTERVRAKGILVIYDEIAVGFGRTGSLFACEQVGCTPDLICLSKGLTAGAMPMSVTVCTEQIFQAFLSSSAGKMFTHGHSFTGNPLSCAVALRSLQMLEENEVGRDWERIESIYRQRLPEFLALKALSRCRVMGTIFACNLAGEDEGYKNQVSEKLRDRFLARGLNIRPLGGAFYVLPPYCVEDAQLHHCLDVMLEEFASLLG